MWAQRACSNAFYRKSFETCTTIVNNEQYYRDAGWLAGWLSAWVHQLTACLSSWPPANLNLEPTDWLTEARTAHAPSFPLSICIFILGSHVGAHGSVRFTIVRLRFGSIGVSIVLWLCVGKAHWKHQSEAYRNLLTVALKRFLFNAQVSLMKFSYCPAARFGVASAASLLPSHPKIEKKTAKTKQNK